MRAKAKAKAQELKQRTMETTKNYGRVKITKLFLAWSENQFYECHKWKCKAHLGRNLRAPYNGEYPS